MQEERLYKRLEKEDGISMYDIRTNIKGKSAYDVYKLLWGMLPEESEPGDENFEVAAVVNTKNGDINVIYKHKNKKIELLEHEEVLYKIELTSRHELAACLFGRDTFERYIPLNELIEYAEKALYVCHRSKIRENMEFVLFRYPHLAK